MSSSLCCAPASCRVPGLKLLSEPSTGHSPAAQERGSAPPCTHRQLGGDQGCSCPAERAEGTGPGHHCHCRAEQIPGIGLSGHPFASGFLFLLGLTIKKANNCGFEEGNIKHWQCFFQGVPDELTCRNTSSSSPCWLQTSWVGEPGPSMAEGTAMAQSLGTAFPGAGVRSHELGLAQTHSPSAPCPCIAPNMRAGACSPWHALDISSSPGLLLPAGHPLADMGKILRQSFVTRALIKW